MHQGDLSYGQLEDGDNHVLGSVGGEKQELCRGGWRLLETYRLTASGNVA